VTPPAPPGRPLPALDPARGAPCANHPGNAADHLCERCGDFICRLCALPVEGRLYCPKCFELLYARGSLSFTQREFHLPVVSLVLGICAVLASLVCVCINLAVSYPLGIAAVWSGARALQEHGRRPDLPGRSLTIAGITLGALGLLVSAGFTVFWLVMMLAPPR